jgi:hypothetical protein
MKYLPCAVRHRCAERCSDLVDEVVIKISAAGPLKLPPSLARLERTSSARPWAFLFTFDQMSADAHGILGFAPMIVLEMVMLYIK